ncbi:small subunit processome component 20 homolog [Anopheles nili]|uniref:small subunit processome component 20 homolog n=1 Tax=Anopheles nili TaxID=185578 RepID=UPI00237AC2B5|nr:small subunit processome component 20 homolog [Anopheles nili]
MKNRPLKHKASNAFRFKSFRERIKEIDVRRGALYRVETDYELPEDENGTFFHQCLVKWSVQNLTDEYTSYQRGFKESVTLALLLFNKDAIVGHLTKCLEKASDDALQPLLELVVAFAKDTRKEFRAYFADLFEVLVKFLYSDSADRVEWTLLCLAHIFKALRSFLRSDFKQTFERLLPLLDERNSPPHATDFATECLGYLARDLKDKAPLVNLMLKSQMTNDGYTVSCGRILFEVLHGVQEHFHTTAKHTLQQFYDILGELPETEADHLQEILTQTITDVIERIQPEDMPTFWDTTRATIDRSLTAAKSDETRVVKYLSRLLQLSGIVLEHQYARLLGDALSPTVSQLIRLLTAFTAPSIEFNETIVNHIIVLLRSKHIRLTQLEASRLTMNVLMMDHRPLYDRFIDATVHCAMFEALIWPNFIKTVEHDPDDARVCFLASLLLKKAPLCGNGLQLNEWKSFPVSVVPGGKFESCMKNILSMRLQQVVGNVELYLSALIILPHLENYQPLQLAKDAIVSFISEGARSIANNSVPHSKRGMAVKICQLIAISVETIVHLADCEGKVCVELMDQLLPIVTAHDCLLLNSVHLLVEYTSENNFNHLLTNARFKRLQPYIHPLISSYNSTARQLASAILAHFADLPELVSSIGPLYKTLAQIERIETQIHTYREQVILFQNLAYDGQLCQEAINAARTEWIETVLRYMMSVYAVNFKLIWEPAGTVVQSYADNLNKSDETLFWNVFQSMLTMAENSVPHRETQQEEMAPEIDDSGARESESDDDEPPVQSLLLKVIECFAKNPTIDYNNVRVQQLRMLQRCANFCRSKGDCIVERFFAFLEATPNQTKPALADVEEETLEGDGDLTDDHGSTKEIRRKSSKSAGKGTQQVLLCYLKICTELTGKSVRKHAARLYSTYETLVSSRHEEIQKTALCGIFALGGSQLTPYKDFITRLTNDNTLKQALLSVFVPSEDIDGDEDGGYASASGRTKIAEEHRPKVVQLVLKVLDGRIKQNLGNGGPGGQHRATILTFFGRLRVEELEMLLARWYDAYLQLLKETPLETVRSIMDVAKDDDGDEGDDGESIFPTPTPFKVKTLLNFLTLIQTEVAPLKSATFASKVMHLKICFDCLLMQMEQAIYKKYKSQTLLALVDVIGQYDGNYHWTEDELSAIMRVHVWPHLANLSSDSIHSPTPLLRLLICWSQSERLYVLLERREIESSGSNAMDVNDTDNSESLTPLDAMISLLRGPQTTGAVCQAIFSALAAMLGSDERTKSKDSVEDKHWSTEVTFYSIDGLNKRSRLLLPYVKDLLQYIRQTVNRKKSISSDLLVILTRLAESGMIVGDQKDEEQIESNCISLLNLLFPILTRRVKESADDRQRAGEDIRRLHIIIMRLLKDVKDPIRYLKQLALSLQNVKDRAARKILFEIFASLATFSPEMQLISNLVHGLNAMDKRWIDQPDQPARTAAYRSIDVLLSATAPDGQRITGNVAIVFLHQAFHVLQYEKDFTARQNASEYVCKVILYLATVNDCPGELQYCLDRIVLQGIVDGLKVKRSTSERRNESIHLLGELSRLVGKPGVTTHPQCRLFAELWHFTGQGDGAERDFFENITHLQSYKHRKAMKRLAIKLADMANSTSSGHEGVSRPSARTTVQFLLPIVSHYICHDEYKKQTSLVEEAGNCIINLCRLLPWKSYHGVLQQYLRRLKFSWEYQKQLLRIVIGIMDAFHFNLSSASAATEETNTTNAANSLMHNKLSLENAEEATIAEVEPESNNETNGGDAGEQTNPQDEKVDDENGDDDVVIEDVPEDVPLTKVNPADELRLAREIVHDIAKTIIPNLLSSFNFATESPVTVSNGAPLDKKARFEKQRGEMLKLPIAIAIVKLFMKLPRKEIELNLPKLIIKVITFLKSRFRLARVQARNTLAHITLELGPYYISFVLQNLLAMLKRGFQRHVLTFTVHTIIERAQTHLATGSVLENILQTVVHLCTEDIFGQLMGLMNGTTIEGGSLKKNSMPEAKSSRKPYQTLYILAKNVQERMLVDLFAPFRAVLSKYRTHQTVSKVQDAFHQLAEGIVVNSSLSSESLLMFIYGMISGQIYMQCAGGESKEDDGETRGHPDKTKRHLGSVTKPGSIYLIPDEPKRYGSAAASTNLDHVLVHGDGNDHVFLECGLELLLCFVKRKQSASRIEQDQEQLFQQLINPIVPALVQSLDSKHSTIICHAINCCSSLLSTQWALKSFQQPETMSAIVKALFDVLHRYNTVALDVNNPNFAMVRASFRAIVAILKHAKSYSFTPEQLRLLVMYVEQDLAVGGGRQTTAFVLLRSLLGRRFTFVELHTLMQKVFEICIRSESDTVRAECRQNIVDYIMNFPVIKKVQNHVLFFVDQLQYDVMSGRESACVLLKTLFQKLPKQTVEHNYSSYFFALGVRLVNEDAAEIRSLVADCIETLLSRLEAKEKSDLVKIIQEMLNDQSRKHCELATQLLLRIIRSEPSAGFISTWLPETLPSLLRNLVPSAKGDNRSTAGQFVKPVASVTTLLSTDPSGDHLIIQTLNMFAELLRLHPTMHTDQKYTETMDALAYTAQSLLGSGHQWIRLGAMKLLYQIMNELDFEAIHERIRVVSERHNGKQSVNDGEMDEENDECDTVAQGKQFLYQSPLRDCKTLTLDLCAQLTPNGTMVNDSDDEAAGLVTQILFLVANVLRAVPLNDDKVTSKKINLSWLIRRVRYIMQSEIVKTPHLFILRKHALHWMSSVVAMLDQDVLLKLAPSLLIPAIRELTAQDIAGERSGKDPLKVTLRKVATKLSKDISMRLGVDQYDKMRNAIEESLRRKRTDRRVRLAQEKINQPIMAARRKEAKKTRTKVAKKRKVQSREDMMEVNGKADDGGFLLGMKRRASSAPKKGFPKKRRNMEAMFRE